MLPGVTSGHTRNRISQRSILLGDAMPLTLGFVLFALLLQQQAACLPGQVVEVNRGKDYTLTLCGGTVVGLRGVEPPLHTAVDGDATRVLSTYRTCSQSVSIVHKRRPPNGYVP